MQNKVIIGTDVSKLTLDNAIKTVGAHQQVSNNSQGYKQWLKWALSYGNKTELWVVMEHTGYYSCQFEKFLQTQGISYSKISALQIKRSCGVIRGKTDKADAFMISYYGWLRKDELKQHPACPQALEELKDLCSLRQKLVKERSGYKARLKEQKATRKYNSKNVQVQIQQKAIERLSADIKTIEAAMKQLIKQNQELQTNFELLKSIKGIGFVIASYMLAYTQNFTRFNNSRQFSCYAGLAPFEHSSGSSIRGKSRVSHYANKKAKSLLNLAASVAIQHNKELKSYYKKRVQEGKNKMSTLNIIRTKLVRTMFAVIKRQSPYRETLCIAA